MKRFLNQYIILIFLFLPLAGCPNAQTGLDTSGVERELTNVPVAEYANDWSEWRGSDHNGIAHTTDWNPKAIENPANIKWKIRIGMGYGGMSVSGPYLYTTGYYLKKKISDCYVYCLDAETGKEIWKYLFPINAHDIPWPGPRSMPTVDNERLYVQGQDGDLFCLNKMTGALVWKTNIFDKNTVPMFGYAASVLIEGDLAIVNASESGMAFNKYTGKLVWNSKKSRGGYAVPVAFDFEGMRYIAMFSAVYLNIEEPATGEIVASYIWKTRDGCNVADPIVSGNRVFIASDYGMGCIMLELVHSGDGLELRKVWENQSIHAHMATPVLVDGYLYGSSGDANWDWGHFVCVDWDTGKTMWTAETPPGMLGTVIAAAGKLILYDDYGQLFIAQATPAGFKPLAQKQFIKFDKKQFLEYRCYTPPTFCRNCIYIRNFIGDLLCLDVSK